MKIFRGMATNIKTLILIDHGIRHNDMLTIRNVLKWVKNADIQSKSDDVQQKYMLYCTCCSFPREAKIINQKKKKWLKG